MRKPAHLSYGVDDKPPLAVNALSGLQHVGLMSIYLVFPALVAKAAGASAEVAVAMVSMTLVALAIGTLLQAFSSGPVGSGFLCQPIASVVYFVPSMVAVKHGGLSAVFGMTIVAGLLEIGLARVLSRLRAIFPAEIAGSWCFWSGSRAASWGCAPPSPAPTPPPSHHRSTWGLR